MVLPLRSISHDQPDCGWVELAFEELISSRSSICSHNGRFLTSFQNQNSLAPRLSQAVCKDESGRSAFLKGFQDQYQARKGRAISKVWQALTSTDDEVIFVLNCLSRNERDGLCYYIFKGQKESLEERDASEESHPEPRTDEGKFRTVRSATEGSFLCVTWIGSHKMTGEHPG